MAFTLTDKALAALFAQSKQPNLVLEIDGISTIYSVVATSQPLLVGDPDFLIGSETDGTTPIVGGLDEIEDQNNAIDLDGTTTTVTQLLQIDLATDGSITSFAIALMDKDGAITKLITPGNLLTDILQTRCKIYLGMANLRFPDDYTVVFRGVVNDVTSDAGKIILTIAHPDDKKQGSTYKVAKPKLSGTINNSQNTITVDSIADLLLPVTGPNGMIDPSFEACVIIENEIIKYTGISVATLTGCVRGYLGTGAASHNDQTDVSAMHRLKGNCIDLALKIMCSTGDGSTPYLDALAPTSFVSVDGLPVANAIYFKLIDVVEKYNVQVGDFVTVTGATSSANNVTLAVINDIIETDTGSYLVLGGVSLVSEIPTGAVVDFISQYNTLPDGLSLINDEVDFDEHLRLQSIFLGTFGYDFQLKSDTTDTRTFIEQQIYSPVACFTLPRKGRCSLGYHIGPIPGQNIVTFNETNIKDPDKIKLQRTTNRYFYNEIIYQFDEDQFTDSQFNSNFIDLAADSKAQIQKTDKTLEIQAKGLRSNGGGLEIAESQSNRRLFWYKFAAEQLSFGVFYADGFAVEIGDIVWIDGSKLQLPDIKTGKKGLAGRYWCVINKKLNIKTGDIQLQCLDTNFANNGRYGLISPSSQVTNGLTVGQFIIGQSFSGRYKTAEHKKWSALVGCTVRVRSADFTLSAETTLADASTNTITVSPALPWVPATGMVMEFVNYPDQAIDQEKLIYVYMSDTAFPDGRKQFSML